MAQKIRPYRSVLYIPGSNVRALEKARDLPADAIIFDLEDSVLPHNKETARAGIAMALAEGGYGSRAKIVRINALDSPWGKDDARAVSRMRPDAVLLPKVKGPEDIDALVELVGAVPVWAMIEAPRGVLNAEAIAAHPQLGGFVIGTNDLAKELSARPHPERQPLLTALGMCLLAARAHNVTVIDGVYNAFKDEAGLRRECTQGRDMGFDGKTLIHPIQISPANDIFAPSAAEIDLARRQIAAFEAAETGGQGVAVVDGKIVENLHIVTAEHTLAMAGAIAALAG